MCRGFDLSERNLNELLKIKAIYVRLLFPPTHSSTSSNSISPYDSLTLHFPPRINGGPLAIAGSSVRSDTPAFVTLHRVVLKEPVAEAAVYGSREKVRVSEGTRFEIYAGDAKLLKGIVRRDEVETGDDWRLDCKCCCSAEEESTPSEADVCVEIEGHAPSIREKVEIDSETRRRRANKTRRSSKMREMCSSLEEIPEQREIESGGGCCCCCSDGGDSEWEVVDGGEECEGEEVVEGVGWAVDVGIWVVCLGVGFLVSKASRNRLISRRRTRTLF
ncbi:OLC1v1028900C1 [Oldenlandia corymbosa var. corymbosa]|uniref:OLC1v1028900C1 n=1 Tax=Oldenlandia corymbosa var. corymbosa TaxID=529605 RepID=A0AAV1CFM9_OLDCO|nr:OLC1v1028900C1 [Oldenlandia corymbosa var. corymbosa]